MKFGNRLRPVVRHDRRDFFPPPTTLLFYFFGVKTQMRFSVETMRSGISNKNTAKCILSARDKREDSLKLTALTFCPLTRWVSALKRRA